MNTGNILGKFTVLCPVTTEIRTHKLSQTNFTPDSKDSSTAQNEIPKTFLVLTVLHSQYYGDGTSYNSCFEIWMKFHGATIQ